MYVNSVDIHYLCCHTVDMQTITIAQWLTQASQLLRARSIASAQLDAEVILAHTLKVPRTWLHAHSDAPIDPRRREIADARIDLRQDHTPVAYIIGHKEFYGRQFRVTPSVLIPRPESEQLIESVKLWRRPQQTRLLDIGTGSGCLAITLQLELPDCHVTASDIDAAALAVARTNAQSLGAEVTFIRSDLMATIPGNYDCIVANLPYVARNWSVSPDTRHEPELALFTGDNGLKLIRRLLTQAADRLPAGGLLFLEADTRQHDALITAAADSYRHTDTRGLIITLERADA